MAAGNNVSVLVVDDEKVVRDFLSRLLSLNGLSVETAENGTRAVEMMKARTFDLVFLDVRMPGMDGVQTLKELKKIGPDSRYVMMTGYSVDDLLEEARKEKIFASIRKPFDISQILSFVQENYPSDGSRKISVLVIDDDPGILALFQRILKDKIYEVTTALSAGSALESIRAKEFDLVFLDIFLGETNGIDLYSRIRQVNPRTQVVLITGDRENAGLDLDKLDVRGCIFKPFDAEKIFSEIEKIKQLKTS